MIRKIALLFLLVFIGVGCAALWGCNTTKNAADVYYVVIAHRLVPGTPCLTLQTGILAYRGRSTPSFIPDELDMLFRYGAPVSTAAALGGYLEVPGGEDEFQNRYLTLKDVAHLWTKQASLAPKIDHPERGPMLLEDARAAGYDLRLTYPVDRLPRKLEGDAYEALPGHAIEECPALMSAQSDPDSIANSWPRIEMTVVALTQPPTFRKDCYIGRIGILSQQDGQIMLTIEDDSSKNLQPYEGFSKILGVGSAAIDITRVDPKSIHLLRQVYLRPQNWDAIRMNAVLDRVRRRGVNIEPDDNSIYSAARTSIPGTIALSPKSSDASTQADCLGRVVSELRTNDQKAAAQNSVERALEMTNGRDN